MRPIGGKGGDGSAQRGRSMISKIALFCAGACPEVWGYSDRMFIGTRAPVFN